MRINKQGVFVSANDTESLNTPASRRRSHWHWTSLLRMTFGVLFLVLGVLGLFLPVLQGVLFLAVGVALLADHIPVFARIRHAAYRRFPRLEHAVHRVRERCRHFRH